MSIKAVSWALDEIEGLHPTRKLVLICLAEAAHGDGTTSFVSQGTISRKCGISDRQVRDHIKALELDGYIKRGDQRHVLHLPANYRPVVWDMNLTQTGRLTSMMRPALKSIPSDRHAGRKPTSVRNPAAGRKPTSGPTGSPASLRPEGRAEAHFRLTENQEINHGGPAERDEILPVCRICERGREQLSEGGVCTDCFEPQPAHPTPSTGGGLSEWHRVKDELKRKREEREGAALEAELRGREIQIRDPKPAEDEGHRR